MDSNYEYKNGIDKNKDIACEQDSQEILREISQIIRTEDKSFDSPVIISKNKPIFNDYNIDIDQLAKDNNISSFSLNYENPNKKNYIKNEKNLDTENNLLINNKQLSLNQKLKYLCSLIQTSNINIRKYEDLIQFNKYLEDKNTIINIFEPINVLFDVINELIIFIQRELRNNDILMEELKRFRYKKSINEREIYKLKMNIKDKDKELNELKNLKKNEYYKNNENEINDLKNENKELYKKINTYKLQMKKIELNNNEMKNRLQSFNNDKLIKINNKTFNLIKYKSNSVIPNLYNITDLYKYNKKNLDETSPCYLRKKTLFYSENRNLIKNRNYSASKVMSFKNLSQNMNNINDSYINSTNYNINNSNKKYKNGRSIISNLMLLLKEINELLNIYNSSLSSIKISNNNLYNNCSIDKKAKIEDNKILEEKNNINIISNDFINKVSKIINNYKEYIKEDDKDQDKLSESKVQLSENKDQSNNKKKLIHVNTSKWKFRKKSHKNNIPKTIYSNDENDNISLSLSNKKNITNKMNMNIKLIDNYMNNEEDNRNKVVKHYTHSNILSQINTDSLNSLNNNNN